MSRELGNAGVHFSPVVGKQMFRHVSLEFRSCISKQESVGHTLAILVSNLPLQITATLSNRITNKRIPMSASINNAFPNRV